MKDKILIIGGCGYIGSALYAYLNRNFNVDTVDLEWFGNFINKKNYKQDYNTLSKNFLKKYTVIILLAGHSSVIMCESHPFSSFKNNLYNFITLLNKIEGQKFIYASSSSIYGKTNRINVSENYNRYLPTNYYDLTKKEIDYYAMLSKVNYFSLRFGTVCGYSPNLRNDVMINKMLETAGKKNVITIYNPKVFRPILGMNDLCRAVEKIINNDKPRGIYNLASFNTTIENAAIKVAEKFKGVKINTAGKFVGYNFSVSTRKFEKTFNFKFEENIDSIIEGMLKSKAEHKSTREITKNLY